MTKAIEFARLTQKPGTKTHLLTIGDRQFLLAESAALSITRDGHDIFLGRKIAQSHRRQIAEEKAREDRN